MYLFLTEVDLSREPILLNCVLSIEIQKKKENKKDMYCDSIMVIFVKKDILRAPLTSFLPTPCKEVKKSALRYCNRKKY